MEVESGFYQLNLNGSGKLIYNWVTNCYYYVQNAKLNLF